MSTGAILVGLLLFGLTIYAATIPWRRQARQAPHAVAETEGVSGGCPDLPRSEAEGAGEPAGIATWRAGQGFGQVATVSLPVQDQLAELEAQREASYAALADLDFDRNVGKLNDDDYQLVRGQLMAQTVAVLQKLDAEAADVESQVEALVSARRAQRSRPAPTANGLSAVSCPACGAVTSAGDRYCGRCGAEPGQACPACGAAVKSGDLFCMHCGSALAVGAATA